MNIERFKIPSHIIRNFLAIKNGRVLACRRQSVSYWTKTKLRSFGQIHHGGGWEAAAVWLAMPAPGCRLRSGRSDMSEILQS